MSRHIAFIGGNKYDNVKLDKFLWNLKEKHPDTIIVTGNGRGAEQHVYDSAVALGYTVKRPKLRPEWYDKPLDSQVGEICEAAEVIVVIGEGSRATKAMNYIHRMNFHERDVRGKLVKRDGKYISHRTPGNEIIFHQL